MAPPVPGFKLNANGVPDFDALPLREGDPRRAAWGLYGSADELGFLNRLTDERVAAAARGEIKSGKRISLNWPLNAQAPNNTFFERAAFHQELTLLNRFVANDDIWTFNSQVSTQWDGLRHFAYQDAKLFYNGVSQEDIHHVDKETGERSKILGINAWSEQGIVGRGVLIDWHGWRASPDGQARSKVKDYDSFESVAIPLEDLQACLEAQGTELKFGDILFTRTGFMATLPTKTEAQMTTYRAAHPHQFGGVEQTEAVLRWIWDHFAAVAGDQPAFERFPSRAGWFMHEVLLAGWGCPIGELFDLEALAAHCRARRRWSFFVASEPCNVPGGVASPPNVLAIF
ncbi:hypothetical protein SAMD00023353_7400380 [Rosellinia necatrix]|uniref:Cyclase protein n=1 Tax=Rosellinia necatrix TaxID=77044 RepID=A0A1W2TT60_ROSNE|nr:hypothetical protein SAMD00023353_7400380 [Rosellinia necatrix]